MERVCLSSSLDPLNAYQSGNLLITEPLNLPPGNVEIVVWAATDTLDHTTTPTTESAPETPKKTN